MDYAGKYLREYETARYTWLERNLRVVDFIIVPDNAEQFADVSFYQAGMDWDVYAQHARAVFLRISQGSWQDSEFEENYVQARSRELLIGGYAFYDGRKSPQQQANTIMIAMREKFFDMELIVDWERDYGGPYEGLPNVVLLMKLLEAAGIRCKAVGTYTGYYWFIENSNARTHAAEYAYLKTKPLWLAWYAAAALVKVPLPWDAWTHWQYATLVVDWGQPTAEIDANKHNGTKAQFEQRYLGGEQPPSEPGGIMKGTVSVASANIRNANNEVVLTAARGSVVYGDVRLAFGLQRLFFTKLYKPDGTIVPYTEERNIAVRDSAGTVILTLEDVPEPTPAQTIPDLPVSITLGDDVTYGKQTITVTLKAKV